MSDWTIVGLYALYALVQGILFIRWSIKNEWIPVEGSIGSLWAVVLLAPMVTFVIIIAVVHDSLEWLCNPNR